MQEIPHILGFTAGELTPWLSSRYDLQAYQRGAAYIQNFIVQPYGGVKRRNGSAFVAESGAGAQDAVKLVPFSYSETDALMLEFFPGGMRVYRDGSLLTAADGATPYVLAVPWTTAEEIHSLRVTQVNDALYVTCPTHCPVVLYRHGDTDWRCENPEFETFPRATYTRQKARLSVKRAQYENRVTLTLPADSDAVFTPGMAGREYILMDVDVPEETLFRNVSFNPVVSELPALKSATTRRYYFYYRKDAATGLYRFWTGMKTFTPADYTGSDDPAHYPDHFMPGVAWSDGVTQITEVCGDWELCTSGTWNAQLELWRAYDHEPVYMTMGTVTNDEKMILGMDCVQNLHWSCVRSFGQSTFSERRNWSLTGSESRPCRMAVVCREADRTSLSALLMFRKFRSRREYKILITQVVDAHTAYGEVQTSYMDVPLEWSSQEWSFGAFGEYNGYPAFSTYSGGRLWFGGMRGNPTTLLGSVVDDFLNFRMGSDDDAALNLTIASDNQSRICWIAPTRQMLVGTSDGVWVLGSGDGSGVVTPTNAAFRRQTSVGCENFPALLTEGSILFPQRGGKRLREISYKLESDGFAASDLSLLAEHLLGAGVREYAVQENIGTYVWLVLQDGTAAVLTLHAEQQVTAWQRVEIPGCRILHVAALPRTSDGTDEIWLVLQRGEGVPLTIQRLCEGNAFLDDAFCGRSDAEGRWQLPLRYAGETVVLLSEGGAPHEVNVPSDALLTDLPADTACTVGVPFTSELHTMPIETINSFNSVREMSRLRLRLYDSSLNLEYKASHAERWERLDAAREHLTTPYTGSVRLSQMPDASVGQNLCFRCSGTEDFRLLGLTVEVDHHGK